MLMVGMKRIELMYTVSKTVALPLSYIPLNSSGHLCVVTSAECISIVA